MANSDEKIIVGSDFRLICKTGIDLTDGASVVIKVRKPDKTIVEHTGAFLTPLTDGKVYKDLTPALNDQAGMLEAWAIVTLTDAKTHISDKDHYKIWAEGE